MFNIYFGFNQEVQDHLSFYPGLGGVSSAHLLQSPIIIIVVARWGHLESRVWVCLSQTNSK